MAFANVWLGVREEAHDAIVTRLRWDEESQGAYTGPVTDREHKLFRYMADQTNVERLYKKTTIGGRVWTLWNLNFTENLPKVKIELDQLLLDRPNHISLAGAWKWTGEQFGTEHVYTTTNEPVTYSKRNPAYDPSEFLEDGTTPNPSYDPRFVVRVTENQDVTRITGKTGVAMYPIPTTALLRFMPDVGEPPVAATVLADVNLSMGQSPRSFF